MNRTIKLRAFILVLVCLLFIGCSVDNDSIATAIENCKNNGGLDTLRWAGPLTLIARCKNGADFKL